MRIAGALTQSQMELVFAHLPVGIAVTDENDVIRFWAGGTFVDCSPKLIDRDIHASHPKRARESLASLLASFKSGELDVVDRIEESSLGLERFVYSALRDEGGIYRGVLQTVLPVEWKPAGGKVPLEGTLTEELLSLVLAHMPLSLGFADEAGVLRFWAGEAFSTCDPSLIGRDLVQRHAEQNKPGVAKLLKDFESGAKDEASSDDEAEHIVYSALRDNAGTYRGVLETVVARSQQSEEGTSMFRPMRRKKQLLSDAATAAMLESCTSGVLALQGDDDYPYAVPLSFAYEDGRIYFHSAVKGHKLDALERSDKASFCVIAADDIVPEKFTTHFRSAIAFGRVRLVTDDAEKRRGLMLLAEKYSPDYLDTAGAEIDGDWKRVSVIALDVEHLTGKASIELVREDA